MIIQKITTKPTVSFCKTKAFYRPFHYRGDFILDKATPGNHFIIRVKDKVTVVREGAYMDIVVPEKRRN